MSASLSLTLLYNLKKKNNVTFDNIKPKAASQVIARLALRVVQ